MRVIVYAILAAIAAIAIVFALIRPGRPGAQHRGRMSLRVLPVFYVAWLIIDFAVTPQDRWVNGTALALIALVGASAFGYQKYAKRQ
jgi:hypothetical protein